MIQKKICMVGVFATGKTSLVRQYVHSIYTEQYHSTVGVKVDRKTVDLDGTEMKLILWDLEGKDGHGNVRASYLRGASAILYTADGTRPETVEGVFELQSLVKDTLGDVPSLAAVNKIDLKDFWAVGDDEYDRLKAAGIDTMFTSAKTGEGVEETFRRLASATREA